MNRFNEINERAFRIKQEMTGLEAEYSLPNTIKGEVYNKRKTQLKNKYRGLEKKALAIGANGVLCHIKGIRKRPHAKNPKLMITEKFNVYFINVTPDEINSLIKLHVKNAIEYTTTFRSLGIITTSS